MPNWAFGNVKVTGTRKGVKSFIERFISDDDPSTVPGKRFFARSFMNEKRQACIDNAMKMFDGLPAEAKAECALDIEFAWSAYTCLIVGYPQRNDKECITLSEACAEDQVSVVIQTSEPGMCFEEHITGDEEGTVIHEERDLSTYKCRHCGETMSLASFEDPEDQDCPECGECGFDRCEEE
jgi:DNA-directed RNA polymerase subunit RPC12/RpoP